jgi:hypothetical protein
MSKPDKIGYLLAVSKDKKVPCIVREAAAIKALMLSLIILNFFAGIATAANDTLTVPKLSAALKTVDPNLISMINNLFAYAIVIVIAIIILAMIFGGGQAGLASIAGNITKRMEGISTIIIGAGIVLLLGFLLILVVSLAG